MSGIGRMRIIALTSLFSGFTRGAVLHDSDVSGLVTAVSVSGLQRWMALEFVGSGASFWKPHQCPPTTTCVDRVDGYPLVVTVEGVPRPAEVGPVALKPSEQSTKYRDVAGVLHLGPASGIAQQGPLWFRKRQGQISVWPHVPRSVEQRHRLDRKHNDEWVVYGALDLTKNWLPSANGRKIVFDFASRDLVLPKRSYERPLTQSTGVAGKRGLWFSHRLHRKCQHRLAVGAAAYTVYVWTREGRFAVPVVWIPGPEVRDGEHAWCPLSLVLTRDDHVRVGRSVLDEWDVVLDARRAELVVAKRTDELRIRNSPQFTPWTWFISKGCARVETEFRCVWEPTADRSGSVYSLWSRSETGAQFLARNQEQRPSKSGNHYWYSNPRVGFARDGRFVLSAELDKDGKYEFRAHDGYGRVTQSFNWPETEPLSSNVEAKGTCYGCGKSITRKDVWGWKLDNCNHVYHSDCLAKRTQKHKTCTCGADAVRPRTLHDDMAMM